MRLALEALIQLEEFAATRDDLLAKLECHMRGADLRIKEGWYEIKVYRLHKKDLEKPGLLEEPPKAAVNEAEAGPL